MSHRNDLEIQRQARVLWNYHCLDTGIAPADFILALGSHDERVAVHAAQLFLEGLAPRLVTSGGRGKVTQHFWDITEGERFAAIARSIGVPDSALLIESNASNTGENIARTRDLMVREGIVVNSGILVTKPYMKRRAYATAAKQWPEITWFVSAPSLSFENYPTDDVPLNRMIELMVGDLQRLRLYADSGFQIYQSIPDDVWECYENLARNGYDRYVLKAEKGGE